MGCPYLNRVGLIASFRNGDRRGVAMALGETFGYQHFDAFPGYPPNSTSCGMSGHIHRVWVLLIAHHCRAPRHWSQIEIELLPKLATQVGIEIKQAALYSQ